MREESWRDIARELFIFNSRQSIFDCGRFCNMVKDNQVLGDVECFGKTSKNPMYRRENVWINKEMSETVLLLDADFFSFNEEMSLSKNSTEHGYTHSHKSP